MIRELENTVYGSKRLRWRELCNFQKFTRRTNAKKPEWDMTRITRNAFQGRRVTSAKNNYTCRRCVGRFGVSHSLGTGLYQ